MWSLLGGESGDGVVVTNLPPLLAVVVTEVRWARRLLGDVEIGLSVSTESWLSDLSSLHVLVWIVNPVGVDNEWRWSWVIRDLNSRHGCHECEEFHCNLLL